MAPAKLPTRQLGKDGPHVTALGFGAMGLSAFYGAPSSDAERLALLDRAYELGELHWDSADMYGDNEDLLGKWFAANPDKRAEIFLATKFGNVVNADGSREVRNEPGYVKEACAKSLRRLGLDSVDLYYCHRLDGRTPIEETVRAMVELKNEGKIKYLGLSECSSSSLRRAHAVHPISAVQVEYSPFTLDIESPQVNLLSTCRELGVAVVAYSPLGRGFLTGAYQSADDFEAGDFRRMAPRFSADNFPRNLKLVAELGRIAARKGCTTGQLTLAWLLAQGEDVVPIPGTKKVKYLEENLKALEVRLSEEEVGEVRRAVENAEVHGGRYPEVMAGLLFRDSPPLKK